MAEALNIELLAKMIRAKRGERGLREVAEEIGSISASTLSRIENGKMPDTETFMRLCAWLQVPAEEFLSPIGSITVKATPEIIEAHLLADKELDPETAAALANMVKAAYEAVRKGKIRRDKPDEEGQ